MITAIYNYPFPALPLGDEYILREQCLEDAEAFYQYYTAPEVSSFILAKTPQSLKEAQEEVDYCQKLFKYRQGIYWAIARRSDNKMIGAVGYYFNNHHHRAELCYDLDQAYWRQGIMTQALRATMQHLFKFAGLHRIEAVTVTNNQPSINILKKLGFEHEGSLKNYRYYNNKPHDIEMFATTKKAFQDYLKTQETESLSVSA